VEATEDGINAEDTTYRAPTEAGKGSWSWNMPNTRALCDRCVRRLPVDGAAVSVFGGLSSMELLHATDPVIARLDDLQFVIGEGPCRDAVRDRAPVLETDLFTDRAARRWPGFSREAVAVGAGAVFVFPLRLGAVPFGVLELYRVTPGGLTIIDLANAVRLADTGAARVLNDFTGASSPVATGPNVVFGQVEVPQATGMIAVQQGGSIEHALTSLRALAFTQNRPVIDVARDVLAGRVSFSEPAAGPGTPTASSGPG